MRKYSKRGVPGLGERGKRKKRKPIRGEDLEKLRLYNIEQEKKENEMRARTVEESMQMPFRNDGNKSLSQKYPLENPNYLGDSANDDKEHDPEADWDMHPTCPACGNEVKDRFINGVCTSCFMQDIYADRFGNVHRREERHKTFEEYTGDFYKNKLNK